MVVEEENRCPRYDTMHSELLELVGMAKRIFESKTMENYWNEHSKRYASFELFICLNCIVEKYKYQISGGIDAYHILFLTSCPYGV